MPQISTTFFNLQWMLSGCLLMLLWYKTINQRPFLYALIAGFLFVICLYIGWDLSTVIAGLCLFIWWVVNNKNLLVLLVLFGLLVVCSMLWQSQFLLFFMVLLSLLLIFETWLYLSSKSGALVLMALLLILAMTISINLTLTHWLLPILVGAFMLLLMNSGKQESENKANDTEHWLSLVEQAKYKERQRIYRNIHDEVGAKLLQMIYQLEGHEAQDLAKTVMQKIRQSVADTAHFSVNMHELFDDLVAEAKLRLSTASITLVTMHDITSTDNLSPSIPASLTKILREAISNIIRHAKATEVQLEITWQPSNKVIILADNGMGMKSDAIRGKGLKSIENRAHQINASVVWQSRSSGGTRMQIRMNQDV